MTNENTNTTTPEDRRLDELLGQIREEKPEAAEACARVRRRLEKDVGWGERGDAPVFELADEGELRGCDDYQQLLPAHLAGELSEGRELLVSDHVRHCITCRRALQELKDPGRREAVSSAAPSSRLRTFAIAASFFAAIFASWFAWRNFWPAGQEDLMEVKSIDGQLFALQEGQLEPLYPGDWVDGRREIRTAKDSGALLELSDGSRVEVNQRSALEVVRKRDGLQVRVDRGDIIVEAARQRDGTLDVSTDEMLVAVKGTIFAVSHGTKGSRVSVIEGEVQVEQSRRQTALYPGDQLGSRATLTAHPLAQEIAWSSDVDRYLAMLEEFGALRNDLNQVLASAEPRYSSDLLAHVPAGTSVYVALPNPTATLTEVYGLVRQRLAANPQLAGQWAELGSDGGLGELDRFIDSVQELSEFLGEETVVALAFDETSADDPLPVVLSQVENATGLHGALEERIAELRLEMPELNVVLLDENTTTVPGGEGLYVFVGSDLLVASTDIAEINRIAGGTTSGFVGSDFHRRVTEAYDRGAEYLGAIDLSALVGSRLDDAEDQAIEFTGLGSVEYLVVERHQDQERAHTAAELSFAGERQGMAAWLAEPAAMEALEFVSANATFASAAVHKDAVLILDEIFGLALEDEEAATELDRVQEEIGIRFRDDLAAALGGELAIALDGPVLPTPSWKVIVEVYDERRLQATLETLVDRVNEEAQQEHAGEPGITLTPVLGNDGLTYWQVTVPTPQSSGQSLFDTEVGFAYTYIDGFLVAAPSKAMVEQAILTRDSGASLVTSEVFQSVLPKDGYMDFSAVVFNRLGETMAELAEKLPRPDGLSEEQAQQIDSMLEEMAAEGPSIYCLYGEQDRIRMVSNSPALLPFSGLSSIIGLGGLPALVSGGPMPGAGI